MRRPRRSLPAWALLGTAAVVLVAPWSAQSFSGGLGDGAISFGGCTCHLSGQGGTEGGGTVTMWASDPNPRVGAPVQVRVNVTMVELSGNALVGVFLLRDFTGGDLDRPSTDGWRIETDPNGGRNSYVERTVPGTGVEVSLPWNLTAPLSAGTYRLFARAQHGGGAMYYEDETAGLEFTVFTDTPPVRNLEGVRAWASEEARAGNVLVLYGEFYANASTDIAGFEVAFYVDGAPVGVLENLTAPRQRLRTFSLPWRAPAEGSYNLSVRADSGGAVDETNEGDNEVSAPVTVLPRIPPEAPGFEVLAVVAAALLAALVHRRRGR